MHLLPVILCQTQAPNLGLRSAWDAEPERSCSRERACTGIASYLSKSMPLVERVFGGPKTCIRLMIHKDLLSLESGVSRGPGFGVLVSGLRCILFMASQSIQGFMGSKTLRVRRRRWSTGSSPSSGFHCQGTRAPEVALAVSGILMSLEAKASTNGPRHNMTPKQQNEPRIKPRPLPINRLQEKLPICKSGQATPGPKTRQLPRALSAARCVCCRSASTLKQKCPRLIWAAWSGFHVLLLCYFLRSVFRIVRTTETSNIMNMISMTVERSSSSSSSSRSSGGSQS